MNIDQNFQAFKRKDIKAIYKIEMKNEKEYFDTQIISKILKVDKNN